MESKFENRIIYLRNKFNVFTPEEGKNILSKRFNGIIETNEEFQYNSDYFLFKNSVLTPITQYSLEDFSLSFYDYTIAIILSNKNDRGRIINQIYISDSIFQDMIKADPTTNKMNTQWMLNVFSKLVLEGKYTAAVQFVIEDLLLASDYLELFESNKRKKKFIELCKNNYALIDQDTHKNVIKNPSDINQYSSLSQLFDAVDPFIKRDSSELRSLLEKYVILNEAEMPVVDRNFTLFIPKSQYASNIFNDYTSWCTTRGSHNSYVNQKRPNGRPSKLYIIINNKIFTPGHIMEDTDLIQVHFESGQIRTRSQNTINLNTHILEKSIALSNYFYDELLIDAKYINKVDGNKYLNWLLQLGYSECLFEFIEPETTKIHIQDKKIPKLPNISKFKNVDTLIIAHAELADLHSSLGSLSELIILSLPYNKIKCLPPEIGNLKNLLFINLKGNKISDIPYSLKFLDKSNGGSLERLVIDTSTMSPCVLDKIVELLPQTRIN